MERSIAASSASTPNLVDGVPTALNAQMAAGDLDVSVVSAVEYARDSRRYLLLPDLAISCDGPVRSVMLFSRRPATELSARQGAGQPKLDDERRAARAAVRERLARPASRFLPTDAEISDVARFAIEDHDARLVIGDAALLLETRSRNPESAAPETLSDEKTAITRFAYDLGEVWKQWTGLPFVFAVWVAQRDIPVEAALEAHASLIRSRDWGIANVPSWRARHLRRPAFQCRRAKNISPASTTDCRIRTSPVSPSSIAGWWSADAFPTAH